MATVKRAKAVASVAPEHERFADLAASEHEAALYAPTLHRRWQHDQRAALYGEASWVALHLATTGERGAEMRGRLAALKSEIASITRDGGL